MNDRKIDTRIKELEEEVTLLSQYLGDAVEERLGKKLEAVTKGLAALKEGGVDFGELSMNLPDYSGTLEEIAKNLPDYSEDLTSIGERLDEQEAALRKGLADISDELTARLAELEKSAGGAAAGTGSGLTDKLADVTAALNGNLAELRDTITKLEAAQSDTRKESRESADRLDGKLTEAGAKLDTLADADLGSRLDGIHESVTSLADENLGTKVGDVGKKVDALAGDMLTADALEERLDRIAETIDTLIAGKFGPKVDGLDGKIDGLDGKVDSVGEKVDGLDGRVGDISSRVGGIDGKIEGIGGDVGDIGGKIEGIGGDVGDIGGLVRGLDGKVDGVGGKVDALAGELPGARKQVIERIAQVETTVKESGDRMSSAHTESAERLMKSLTAVRDNVDVLRRMCSTDEEKFIGSMATVVYNHVTDLAEQLPDVLQSLKKWFMTLDKNSGQHAASILEKQEETKKLLVYDLEKLSETATNIQALCYTAEERPIGGEVLVTSDRVEAMHARIPDMHDKITNFHDELMAMTAEVKRMRWFVLGAVAVSIIVLIVSFVT